MNREKYQALCEEFPFLVRYLSPDWKPVVNVKLPEPELLERRSRYYHEAPGEFHDGFPAHTVFFVILGRNGEELRLMKVKGRFRSGWNPLNWLFPESLESKHTLGEEVAIENLLGNKVYFIIELSCFGSTGLVFDATVYRPRRGRTFLETIEEIRQARLETARTEMKKVAQEEN